jgi:hypothetical protein
MEKSAAISKPPFVAYHFLALLFIIGMAISVQFELIVQFPIKDGFDAFHMGEFVASALGIIKPAPFAGDPFTIHGAADFWPALLVNSLDLSNSKFIAYTVAIYPLLSIFTALLIFLVTVRLALIFQSNPIFLAPVFCFAPYCMGWRELFFFLSMVIFIELVSIAPNFQRRKIILQLLFGTSIALGIYWNFSRAVVAIAAFGPITLWLAFRDPRYFISVGTAFSVFFALGLFVPGISVQGFFENFIMLLNTSSQWNLPVSPKTIVSSVLILGLTALALLRVFQYLRSSGYNETQIALFFPLAIASIIYCKVALMRIAAENVLLALIVPLILVCLTTRSRKVDSKDAVARLMLAAIAAGVIVYLNVSGYFYYVTILIVVVAFLLIFFEATMEPALYRVSVTIVCAFCLGSAMTAPTGEFKKIRSSKVAPPIDEMVLSNSISPVSEGVGWVAQKLKTNGASCVFDLTNTGLINGASFLPACSRFTYPVYATSEFEGWLINDLLATLPPVIVYSAEHWSYEIDNRPMNERFPALDKAIHSHYSKEECNYGYCLQYKIINPVPNL